jgi:hypothetical protein
LIWTLFLLLVVIAIAILVWDVRRKIAAREVASKRRFEEMLLAKSAAPASPAAPQVPAPVPPAATSAKPTSPAAAISAKGRFLGQSETLIYRLLKAGLPDHEIFANVTLASVIAGGNEQEARRLSQYRIDFVVCDKGMRVVAVVEIERIGGALATGEQHFVADRLKAAGIGLVRLNPLAPPRRDQIRALVCGQSAATDG